MAPQYLTMEQLKVLSESPQAWISGLGTIKPDLWAVLPASPIPTEVRLGSHGRLQLVGCRYIRLAFDLKAAAATNVVSQQYGPAIGVDIGGARIELHD